MSPWSCGTRRSPVHGNCSSIGHSSNDQVVGCDIVNAVGTVSRHPHNISWAGLPGSSLVNGSLCCNGKVTTGQAVDQTTRFGTHNQPVMVIQIPFELPIMLQPPERRRREQEVLRAPGLQLLQ